MFKRLLPGVCLAALVACSHSEHPASSAPSSPEVAYAAVARGQVDVEHGLLEVVARTSGSVNRILVNTGDRVHAGQKLAELSTDTAELALLKAKAEQQHAEAAALVLSQQLAAVRRQAERMQAAVQAGVGTQQQSDEATQNLVQLQARIAEAQAGVALAVNQVQQAQLEISLATITAPVDGLITQTLLQRGQWIDASNHPGLFKILPHEPLIIRAEVNEDYIGHVHPGQAALVTLESSSVTAVPLAAHVTRIGQILQKGILSESPRLANDFECILTLDPPKNDTTVLHIGQTVMVKLL